MLQKIYSFYFNSFSTSQRGLAILIKDSLPVTDIKIENIIKGNYTKLTFKLKDQKILIKCIYAPNKDMTNNEVDNESNIFFKTVFNNKNDDEYDLKITVGNFNVAPKHEMDTLGSLHVNNQNTRNFLKRMIPLSNMTDIWRKKYPQTRQYTFFKKQTNNFTRSRLDYFLMDENSTDLVKKVGMGKVCTLSDHMPIFLHISLTKVQKGRGFWRLNNLSLIHI